MQRTNANPEADPTGPLDVWLKFGPSYVDLADYEANTFQDGDRYRVDWYHNDVGQVTSEYFDTYDEATAWCEREGFADFTVIED